jgi:ribosomal protein S12 methylthiotransferase accessory factor
MFERELPPSEALFNIMSTIHALGLKPVTRYADPAKLVATAELFDKDNNLVESGAGKGPDALIGALAESVEHLSTFHSHIDNLTWQRSDTIGAQKSSREDGLLINLPITEDLIECFRLTALCDEESLFVPSILLCPRSASSADKYNHKVMQFLTRYSSNSGIAFGCTEAEALLHGAHEVIERHILSLFYMAVCSIGPKIELYAPSSALLAEALQNNPSALEAADKLQVVIIKDILSVYFSVAFPKKGPGDLHLSAIGSGCSLDICTAIQRAVTEQFQTNLLYDSTEESIDRKTLNLLSNSNRLKNLIDFAPIKNLKLPTIDQTSKISTSTVPEQLKILDKSLSITDRKIFQRTVARFSTNCIVTQVYIPGLERFNIIRNGLLVAPQHILLGT